MRHATASTLALALCTSTLLACGASFSIGNERYATRQVTAQAIDQLSFEGIKLSGVRVTLSSEAARQIDADVVSVNITLVWPADAPPPVGRELKLSSASTSFSSAATQVLASVDIDCRCSGRVQASSEPLANGRFRLDRLSSQDVAGWFDVKFSGNLPLTSGGIGFDNSSLTAASAFSAKRDESLQPK